MAEKKFLPVAFLNNEWKPFSEANISIATHALHYGTAAFGWLRGMISPENPEEMLLFRLDRHAKRLSESAKFLGYAIAPEKIYDTIVEFVRRNKPKNPIYIRPLVYTSDLDISPRLNDIEKNLLVYGLELGDYLPASGVKVTISSWTRQSDASFPLRGKISGAYITSALAKNEAVNRGFDDAILMNKDGKVCEWSAMNIFIVRNGVIRTPAPTEDILEGITRASVIDIARSLGYTVEEWRIDKTELFIADEVFFTGTAARVASVRQIEQYLLPESHPITDILKARFETIVRGQDAVFQDWITRIPLA